MNLGDGPVLFTTMNLFILNKDPKAAAVAHADRHVIKMILEACQMLYTAHWTSAYPEIIKKKKSMELPASMKSAPKKKNTEIHGFLAAHINHPCTKWIRGSLENYMFACELAIEIGKEYTFRYGKVHACMEHAVWLKENPPSLTAVGLTPFAIAMDDQYKISDDAIECYRHYYLTAKSHLLIYTKREKPQFVCK